MSHALIGYTGFVGSTLLKQAHFEGRFRSTNMSEIRGQTFDTLVCAGAPAQKWIANREPEADAANIQGLIDHLDSVRCERCVLISTVDVFKEPVGVDENTPVEEAGLYAYGRNRRLLERFVAERFQNALIVRLPGLVGPGLRKNVLFDFLNDNRLDAIESRGIFQFYPMVNLWYDIQTALQAGLPLLHLTAEPISVAQIARQAFNRRFDQTLSGTPAHYDIRSRHSALFGTQGPYQYSQRDTLLAARAYAQSEARTLPSTPAPTV